MLSIFTIKYKKKLNSIFDTISDKEIIETFANDFRVTGVDKIIIENDSYFSYKNNFFSIKPGWNWNRWVGICRGEIKITKINDDRNIYYSFDVLIIVLVGLTFGIFSFVSTKNFTSSIIGLILGLGIIGGVNVLITAIIHFDNLIGILNSISIKLKN